MKMNESHKACEVQEQTVLYKIGMFANMNRVTIKTLRYYDEQNLLKPVYVDEENGYRYYAGGQIAELHRLLALRGMGFSIDDIQKIYESYGENDAVKQNFINNLRRKDMRATLSMYLKYTTVEEDKVGFVSFSRLEEIKNDFPNTVIGRPHIAAELVKKKIVKNSQQAFNKYLAKGKPWYASRIGLNLDEAIVAIKESDGIPVIAHPMSLYISWGKLPETLQDFYERGVCGLEAFHPGARVTECLRLEELARKIGYFVTAGSDFHGEKIRSDRKLGFTCGGKKIDDKYYFEELAKFK